MAKRSRDETEEERQARKQRKKEAKKRKKAEKKENSAASGPVSQEKSVRLRDVSSRPSDESSSFQRKRLRLVVSLYPSALDDVLSHVKKSLHTMLLKFSDGIGGILLAFEKVKLADGNTGEPGHGVILNELPQIHYLVELDALVFCPVVGQKLTGVVNECFPSHVGMLVHSFFNAMISSDHMHSAGYVFDPDLQEWTQEVGAGVLGNEDRVDFVVQTIHECAGVVSLEGSNPRLSCTAVFHNI